MNEIETENAALRKQNDKLRDQLALALEQLVDARNELRKPIVKNPSFLLT